MSIRPTIAFILDKENIQKTPSVTTLALELRLYLNKDLRESKG